MRLLSALTRRAQVNQDVSSALNSDSNPQDMPAILLCPQSVDQAMGLEMLPWGGRSGRLAG